jgi:hypothetical protein
MKLLIVVGFGVTVLVWSTYGAGWGLLTALLFMGGFGWSLIGALLLALGSLVRALLFRGAFGVRTDGSASGQGRERVTSIDQDTVAGPSLVRHVALFRDGRGVTLSLFSELRGEPHRWSWVFDDGLDGYDPRTAELAEIAMTKIEKELDLPLSWPYRDFEGP